MAGRVASAHAEKVRKRRANKCWEVWEGESKEGAGGEVCRGVLEPGSGWGLIVSGWREDKNEVRCTSVANSSPPFKACHASVRRTERFRGGTLGVEASLAVAAVGVSLR